MIIKIHIQPNAKKDEIVSMGTDPRYSDDKRLAKGSVPVVIKIRLKAAPVDGKANEALIKFLSKKLGIPKSAIEIKAGHTSRQKILSIIGNSILEKLKA